MNDESNRLTVVCQFRISQPLWQAFDLESAKRAGELGLTKSRAKASMFREAMISYLRSRGRNHEEV